MVAQLVAPHRSLALSALISLAIAAAVLPPVALVLLRVDRIARWAALAAVVSIACIAGQLTATASGLYYGKYIWPVVLAAALIVVVDVARSGRASALAMVLTSAAVLLGYEPRLAHGHKRPVVHYADLVANIAYARTAEPRAAKDPDYDRLLALVPGGRVGVWVVRPERLDYTHHAIVDLRVPRVWRDRARPWQPEARDSVIRLLRAEKLRYLLIEDDGAAQRYSEENPVAGWLCGDHCLDPLERVLASQHLLGTSGATRLYELH
jgi:hypothetical protein